MNDNLAGGGQALIQSVWSDRVRDITSEAAEILLDATLDEGLLREIPVFGWIAKTFGFVSSIRERIFLKKILRFLHETQATTAKERRMFAARMEADPEHQQKVGESLFLLLDRHETVEKSELLGRLFAALIRMDISDRDFERYAYILDRLFVEDLIGLAKHYEKISEYEAAKKSGAKGNQAAFLKHGTRTQAFFSSGLLDASGWVETVYLRNEQGEKLIQILAGGVGGQDQDT